MQGICLRLQYLYRYEYSYDVRVLYVGRPAGAKRVGDSPRLGMRRRNEIRRHSNGIRRNIRIQGFNKIGASRSSSVLKTRCPLGIP